MQPKVERLEICRNPMPPLRIGAAAAKIRRQPSQRLNNNLALTLVTFLLFIAPILLLLRHPRTNDSNCGEGSPSSGGKPSSGDLRLIDFALNRLNFTDHSSPRVALRIAVFSKNWGVLPTTGVEHVHTALAARGHKIHVFTSPNVNKVAAKSTGLSNLVVHWHDGEPEKWHYDQAWELFQGENRRKKFDVIHSDGVALPFWLAQHLPNVVVSWHALALESVQSIIYQDLALRSDTPPSPDFTRALEESIPKVLDEIRFFSKYQHHVATTDSSGEMLRDVYQIRPERVHVIYNGVNEKKFVKDSAVGKKLRSLLSIPKNATLVLGTAGRLVRDEGHPLLFKAFSNLRLKKPNVYLLVAGSGPWLKRYKKLGSQVLVLGTLKPSQVRAFYNAIDVFVSPSLRPQGLDITMIEAMMASKPVMASRLPSIKGTLITYEELGFLFPPNVNSLYETLEMAVNEGPTRLAQRGVACRKYASSIFAAGRMVSAYERLFICIANPDAYCGFP